MVHIDQNVVMGFMNYNHFSMSVQRSCKGDNESEYLIHAHDIPAKLILFPHLTNDNTKAPKVN